MSGDDVYLDGLSKHLRNFVEAAMRVSVAHAEDVRSVEDDPRIVALLSLAVLVPTVAQLRTVRSDRQ